MLDFKKKCMDISRYILFSKENVADMKIIVYLCTRQAKIDINLKKEYYE